MRKYLSLLERTIRAQMEYNRSVILLLIGEFIAQFTFILSFLILFHSLGNVRGYRVWQAVLIYATVNICYTIAEMGGKGINDLGKIVRSGKLDVYFLRPMPILLQVMGNAFEFSRVGRLVQAVLIFGIALGAAHPRWNGLTPFILVGIIAGGIALFLSIYLFFGTLTIFTTNPISITALLMGSGSRVLHYPTNSLPGGVRFLLTFILPFGCVNYQPFRYLFGFTTNWLVGLSPLVGLGCLGGVLLFWRFALTRYSSTGS